MVRTAIDIAATLGMGDPTPITENWTWRKFTMVQLHVVRLKWERSQRETYLACVAGGHKFESAAEPDWYDCHWKPDVDPYASLEEQLRQWNENVQPRIDADLKAGKFSRKVGKAEDTETEKLSIRV